MATKRKPTKRRKIAPHLPMQSGRDLVARDTEWVAKENKRIKDLQERVAQDARWLAIVNRLDYFEPHIEQLLAKESRRIDDMQAQIGETSRGKHTIAQGVLEIVTERNRVAEMRINELEARLLQLERNERERR